MGLDEGIKVVAGLAGAVLGFLLKVWYDRRQGRKLPIRYSVDLDRIFSANPELQAQVTVHQGTKKFSYDHLALVKVTITNRGNNDLDSFAFGLTVPDDHDIVVAQCEGADRHHVATFAATPLPALPIRNLDVTCVPFHRDDAYILKIYVRSETTPLTKESIQLRGCQKTGNNNRLTAARDLRPAMTGPCPFHKENCHGGRLYAGGVF